MHKSFAQSTEDTLNPALVDSLLDVELNPFDVPAEFLIMKWNKWDGPAGWWMGRCHCVGNICAALLRVRLYYWDISYTFTFCGVRVTFIQAYTYIFESCCVNIELSISNCAIRECEVYVCVCVQVIPTSLLVWLICVVCLSRYFQLSHRLSRRFPLWYVQDTYICWSENHGKSCFWLNWETMTTMSSLSYQCTQLLLQKYMKNNKITEYHKRFQRYYRFLYCMIVYFTCKVFCL